MDLLYILCSVSIFLIYYAGITQVMSTTKSVYKECSHAKETAKQAMDGCLASSALQIAFMIQALHFSCATITQSSEVPG